MASEPVPVVTGRWMEVPPCPDQWIVQYASGQHRHTFAYDNEKDAKQNAESKKFARVVFVPGENHGK